MDKLLYDTLKLLGLGQKEIRFFIACFEIGPATINDVAKRARIQRSTAYLIAQDLITQRLIEENLHQYKKKISTIDPSDLLRILSSKQRTIGRQEIELEEKLPDLQAIYQASNARPNVKVFEGVSGLFSIQTDILSARKEILLWTNQETENKFFTKEFHDKFIELRKRKGTFIKVLAVNNEKGHGLKSSDKGNLRETHLLPKGINFSSETYIYDGKIAILDYKKDIIGVIIQSEPMSQAQKAIFDLTWNNS
jgi:sugar-specific transcriptional regulator TrmB